VIAQDFHASFDLHLLAEVKYTLIRTALVDVLTHAKIVVVEGVAAPTAPDTPTTSTAASNTVSGLRNLVIVLEPAIDPPSAAHKRRGRAAAGPCLPEAYNTSGAGCRSWQRLFGDARRRLAQSSEAQGK